MRATLLHAPGDIRTTELPDPAPTAPTDAVIRTVASCVCGSDLWKYRGISAVPEPVAVGHEYVGIVEEIGSEVRTLRPGQFVVGSFFSSDNTCATCRAGYQPSCAQAEFLTGAQAEYVRIPLADGTLLALPDHPDPERIPDLLALSDVMGTGRWAATAGGVVPGATVAVVGDGAVGLCAVHAAAQAGAERIIAMSRHPMRQQLAREFGATDIVTARGEEGAAQVRELTAGLGAESVLECVGTADSLRQALRAARPGGTVGYVGVPHGVQLDGRELYQTHVALRGGPAPVRRFLPELIDQVLHGTLRPGRVFDRTLPLAEVAEGYRAMDHREAVKVLLTP